MAGFFLLLTLIVVIAIGIRLFLDDIKKNTAQTGGGLSPNKHRFSKKKGYCPGRSKSLFPSIKKMYRSNLRFNYTPFKRRRPSKKNL